LCRTASALRSTVAQTRDLETVTCFKCKEKGHYADKCPDRGKYPSQQGMSGLPTSPSSGAGGGSGSGSGGGPNKMVSIPNDKVGLIIGKGGATLRQIQEQSGARVVIPKEPDPANPTVRELTVCVAPESFAPADGTHGCATRAPAWSHAHTHTHMFARSPVRTFARSVAHAFAPSTRGRAHTATP
jgi:hypothetical protein